MVDSPVHNTPPHKEEKHKASQPFTNFLLIRQSRFRDDIYKTITTESPRDVLLSSLFYANLSFFVAVLLAADGMGVRTTITYGLIAFFVSTLTGITVRVIVPNTSVMIGLLIIGLATIINDFMIGASLIFDYFGESTNDPDHAIFWLTMAAFISLPLSTRLITPFVIGKTFIFGICISYILAQDNPAFSKTGIVSPLILAYVLTLAVGYWFFLRYINQLHLSEELRHMHGLAERQNRKLEDAIIAERTAKLTAEREHKFRKKLYDYIGHDLRQPISALGLMLYDMEKDKLEEHQKDFIRDARTCVRSANTMIEEVLSISSNDTPMGNVQKEDTNLNSIFGTLGREFHAPVQQSGGALKVLPTTLTAHTDPQILMRILRNFLSNTVKYAAGSRVLLCARLRDNKVNIHVIDTGPGIAQNDLDHLFTDFYRGDAGRKNDPGGFGLGLSIAKQLAEACHGDVTIQSRIDHGTCCTLHLPYIQKR